MTDEDSVPSDSDDERPSCHRTQHCECGSEMYHIHGTPEGDIWATCADCGRPTATVGVGREKQRAWYNDE